MVCAKGRNIDDKKAALKEKDMKRDTDREMRKYE
jgi:tmRNA-binding protein